MIDIGVVYYEIRPEGGQIDAKWYTTRLEAKQAGTGLAIGDTSNGFPGRYEISYYFPDGALSIVLDLEIEKTGDVYELRYKKDGETLLAGVGFETPHGLVAGYRKLGEPGHE